MRVLLWSGGEASIRSTTDASPRPTPTPPPPPPPGHREIKVYGPSGACRLTLTGHEAPVLCLLPLPNNHLLSGSGDGTIRRWDLAQGTCVAVLR